MADVKRREFQTDLSALQVGQEIGKFLKNGKGLYVEGVEIDNGYFVQAKGEQNWKRFVGMDMATQVQVLNINGGVLIEIGQGKWSDKIGAGVAGLVLFAPLAVTAAFGAYQQGKLPDEILNHALLFINSAGKMYDGGASNSNNFNSAPTENSVKSNITAIKEFKELLDAGIITEEEFAIKKKELLGL